MSKPIVYRDKKTRKISTISRKNKAKVAPEILPPRYLLESVDNHFYRIGLCPTPYNYSESMRRRKKNYHPIFIISVIIFQVIKSSVSLLFDDRFVSILFGDFSRMLGMSAHINIHLIFFCLMNLFSIANWYFNHKNNRVPKILDIFLMMSGKESPESVGLNDSKLIQSLVKKTKILHKVVQFFTERMIPFGGVVIMFGTYLIEAQLYETAIFGTANTIHYSFLMHHGYNITLFEAIYFHIICIYLKHRIRKINEKIIKVKRVRSDLAHLKMLEELYKQIDEYNKFISIYILEICVFMSVNSLFMLYVAIFSDVNLIFALVYYLSSTLLTTLLLYVLHNASSVNSEAYKSYRILNSIYVKYYRNKKPLMNSLLIKLKASPSNHYYIIHKLSYFSPRYFQ